MLQCRPSPVTASNGFTIGSAETLVAMPTLTSAWDVDRRSGKMVIGQAVGENVPRIVVIQNWLAQFERGHK